MTVVDIGANVGYYTLIAASVVGASGKVYAFEPEPSNYELLTRNIAANGHKNVLPSPEAVSDRVGSMKLYIDSQNFGNRSFSQQNIVHDGGAVDVNTTTLDCLCLSGKIAKQIDVMKIDAQGAEGFI
ncbi:MAG TPA: methyltransferase, partial [Blastocatellia bacterium]|nr:methyltransferase [Blastocatellia bacterium]